MSKFAIELRKFMSKSTIRLREFMSKSTIKLENLKKFLGLELNKDYSIKELTNIINTPDNNGWTPLFTALYHNNSEMVKLLLGNGANINTKTNSGDTPLYRAVDNNNPEMVKLLLDNGAQASINIPNNDGKTPLYRAVVMNNPEMVKLLLDNGASINTPDNNGWTPLYRAVDNSKPEMVKLLLDNGAQASINTPDNDGWTPLCWAVCRDNPEMVKLLLGNGANINTKTNSGDTPLYRAVDNNNPEMVKLLLDNGAQASINTPNNDGWTPLYGAVDMNNTEMVKLLLRHGVEMDKKLNLFLNSSRINKLPDDIKYKLADMVFCYRNNIHPDSDDKSDDRIDNFIQTFNLPTDNLKELLLNIAINNIDLLNINLFLQYTKVKESINKDPSILENKLLGLGGVFSTKELYTSTFTPEFKEFYNLPKYIKLGNENSNNSSKLREKLGNANIKHQTLLANYELIKNFVSPHSAIIEKLERFEREYLNFNEEEAIKFIIKLLASGNTSNSVSNQSSINHTFTQSSSAKAKRSSYEEDEKEPAESNSEGSLDESDEKGANQSNRAMKLLDIAFDYIEILNISLVFEMKEVEDLINKYSSILESKVKKMLDIEKLETIFISEFREFYNLPRFIKFNDKFKIDLLEKLQNKYSTLFDNYNLLKNYFTSSENELIFKNCEEFLLFNEKEESDFVDKLWLEQRFEDVKNQATDGNNNSQDNREISSLDDDEKGPNLWESDQQKESHNTQNHACTTTVSNDNTTSTVTQTDSSSVPNTVADELTSTSNEENPLNLAGADS